MGDVRQIVGQNRFTLAAPDAPATSIPPAAKPEVLPAADLILDVTTTEQ